MKRKQFNEEQIIGILKEAEAGAVVTELCRKHGMSGRPITPGRPNTAGWRCPRRSGCARSRTRIDC